MHPETEWDRTIDLTEVWETDDMPYQEQRDTIVARIQASGWLTEPDSINRLAPAVEQLTTASSHDQFEDLWEPIERHAEDTLVWIYYTKADIPRITPDQAQQYTGKQVTITLVSGKFHAGTVSTVTKYSRTLVLRGTGHTVSIGLSAIADITVE